MTRVEYDNAIKIKFILKPLHNRNSEVFDRVSHYASKFNTSLSVCVSVTCPTQMERSEQCKRSISIPDSNLINWHAALPFHWFFGKAVPTNQQLQTNKQTNKQTDSNTFGMKSNYSSYCEDTRLLMYLLIFWHLMKSWSYKEPRSPVQLWPSSCIKLSYLYRWFMCVYGCIWKLSVCMRDRLWNTVRVNISTDT